MYLNVTDLISYFGADELIMLTSDRVRGNVEPADLERYANDPQSIGADPLVVKVYGLVEAAIAQAEGTAIGYVRSHYPEASVFTRETVPTDLKGITADMARWMLANDNITAVIQARYEHALEFLRDVSKGRLALSINELRQAPSHHGHVMAARRDELPSRVFGRSGSEDNFLTGY